MRLLISHGADVNAMDQDTFDIGSTPLQHAALTTQLEVIKILLVAGADINATSNRGTAANWALRCKKFPPRNGSRLLLDRGIDINTQSRDEVLS